MAKNFSTGDVNLGTGAHGGSTRPANTTPFQILVLGDFSGRGDRLRSDVSRSLADSRPIALNRDNFNDVMARLGVGCEVHIGENDDSPVALRFQQLSDFHPDHLYEAIPVFSRFRELRRHLLSPTTFEKAAAEVRAWGILKTDHDEQADSPPKPPIQAAPDPAPEAGSLDNLLEQTLDQTNQNRQSGSADLTRAAELPTELADLVKRSIDPYRIQKADPALEDLVACVDSVAGQVMRAVLHDRNYQALEAAWRSLAFLAFRLNTGQKLKIFLVDVSLAELAEDFKNSEGITNSGVYRLLVDQTVGTPGSDPWSVIVGNYAFGRQPVDILLAACLSRIASRAAAPFLAAADPLILGCDSWAGSPDPGDWQAEQPQQLEETWQGVRALSESTYLGLTTPRILLRLPYGADSNPVRSFPFQEVIEFGDHESYLWGNPAFACAYLLATSFDADGWQMRPESCRRVDELPLFVFEAPGEELVLPCSESLMSERTAVKVAEAGLMPFLSVKDTASVQLGCWQSLAGPLAGPWN